MNDGRKSRINPREIDHFLGGKEVFYSARMILRDGLIVSCELLVTEKGKWWETAGKKKERNKEKTPKLLSHILTTS